MKLWIFLLLIAFCTPMLIDAQSNAVVHSPDTSTYIHATKFSISKPFREFPDYKPAKGVKKQEAADKIRRTAGTKSSLFRPENNYTDPVRQITPGSINGSDPTLVNFEGTADSIWDPGDPNGAVSSSYYVQTENITYTVFNKNGGVVLAAKDLGSLWPGDPQDGDPVVLYDKFADRWFLSEFQTDNSPYQLCVAVSQTNDPAGAYYVWVFSLGNYHPDYPKYSIWTDGYYVTFQKFDANGSSLAVPQQVGVLERNRMLKGDPDAGIIFANLPTPPDFQGGPYNSLNSAPKTLDCDASALPPYGVPNYLVFFENVASGGYSNSIVMYKLVTDTTQHTLTVSRADSFAVPTFNGRFDGPNNNADISQPGYLHGVDALDGTFNFRVPYVKFTGYNSVVLSNTVNLGNKVAGIRWYELRQNDTTQVWSIHQQSTYAPNDIISRWNGSICMDYNGDMALQYCVADSVSVYPGIRYTGRLVSDPPNTMTFAEQTAIAGTSTLSSTGGRWGDYSELDIDPSDGLTFWGINQYGGYPNIGGGTQLNRIFSFRLSNFLGINEVQNNTDVKVYQDGNFLNVKATGLPGNEQLVVNLFDISGRQLTTQFVTPASNMFKTKINVSTLPKGLYLVRIGRMNFQRVVKTVIY